MVAPVFGKSVTVLSCAAISNVCLESIDLIGRNLPTTCHAGKATLRTSMVHLEELFTCIEMGLT